MITHPFYRHHNLRLHEIPKGVKCPVVKDWPNTTKTADDVDPLLDGERNNKYGWILDETHVVIDIDVHAEKANGFNALEELEAELGFTLESVCGAIVETPSGGRHYYFTKPASVKFGKVFKDRYPGIDFINGHGKQVIAANSFHDTCEGRYAMRGSGELLPVPESLVAHLQAQRPPERPAAPFVTAERSGDEFNQSTRGLALIAGELVARGYTLRDRGDYHEWDRPGKTTGSKCSGHLGKRSKSGNYQLVCFTLSDPVFPSGESMSIFHAYAMLCHGGDHTAAASALHDRGFAVQDQSDVDLSFFLGASRGPDDDTDDERFCLGMVPPSGLLRDLFNAYWDSAFMRCGVMGLSTAIAISQTVIGRKVASWTGLAPNDYHLVLAGTASGKEGPLTFASNLMHRADGGGLMLPEKIQSGNGMLSAMAKNPCGLWMRDEFGYVLASILDKKNRDANAKAIAETMLSLYGKSNSRFSGSAYAGGSKHEIERPHLTVFGVSTGHTVFKEICEDQVMDGMLGRFTFWRVHDQAEINWDCQPIPDSVVDLVRRWIEWEPKLGTIAEAMGETYRIMPTEEAETRWKSHLLKIHERRGKEAAIRSGMWGRTAARSMKLSIVHRLSRMDPSEFNQFNLPMIEIEDINWGIKLANWSANLGCDLVRETVPDTIGGKVAHDVITILTTAGKPVKLSFVSGKMKRTDASQIRAAITTLEDAGQITTRTEKTTGRPVVWLEARRL
jgi:hypothetical protein